MFKFVVLCALVAAASALNPHGLKSLGGSHHQQSHRSASVASSDDAHAEVKSLSSDVRPDGFEYSFDTTNGIAASESGDAEGNAHGDFSWISPEGEHVSVQYVADENGYQPQSDLLPTPPPVPAAILKALEYIRTHPPKEEYHQASHSNSAPHNTGFQSNAFHGSTHRSNSNRRHF